MRDCITMCFDICAINIRVSIRVRGLHLVFVSEAVYLGGKLGNTLQGPSDLVGGVINPMLTLHDSMRELGKLRFLWVQFHQ